jgi:photosystem II stability/assembly factor-like uncharacterized protein
LQDRLGCNKLVMTLEPKNVRKQSFQAKKITLGYWMYRTPEEIWVSGGSSDLMRSVDSGKTWEKDYAIQGVPSNLYKILFLSQDQGFIIGQRGILLKYDASVAAPPAA